MATVAAPALTPPARLGLQPLPGSVLHQLDLLRRGRPGHRPALVVPADLPRTGAADAVRALGAAEDDHDQQAGEHHLHRRLHRRPLRQVAGAGGGGGADLHGRRAALHRPATERHRPRGESADRLRGRLHRYPRPGHGADRVAGAGAVHHRLRYPQPGCHRTPPRHGPGHRLRVAGQAHRLPRRGHLRHLRPLRRLRRSLLPGPRRAAVGRLLGRDRALAGDAAADRRGDDRDHVPAAAIPRHRGGEHRAARPQPGALGVPHLPGAGRVVRGADRPRRPVAPARRGNAGLLRHQPAAGRGTPGAGPAGIHRRRLGRHRNGHRRQRRAVDHGLQRHAPAVAAATPGKGHRTALRGLPSLAADRAPGEHRGDPAARLRGLPPARLQRQPGDHRPDRLRRHRPARPGDDRRAVLETGQPPRGLRRPRRRLAAVGLYAGPAGGGQGPWLAAGAHPRPDLAGKQSLRPADRAANPGRADLAGRQLRPVRPGLGALAHPRVRALAGQPLHRPGDLPAAELALHARGAGGRPADARRAFRRRGTRAAKLHPLRLPPGQGLHPEPDRQQRVDRAHRAPARRGPRRVLGAGGGEGRHRRARDAGGGRGADRRRSLRGAAIQPRPAAGRDREHHPGHQRGRPVAAPGGLEPPLPGTVRVPGRADLRRPTDR